MLKKYIQKIWEISDIKKAEVMIVKVSPLLLLLHLASSASVSKVCSGEFPSLLDFFQTTFNCIWLLEIENCRWLLLASHLRSRCPSWCSHLRHHHSPSSWGFQQMNVQNFTYQLECAKSASWTPKVFAVHDEDFTLELDIQIRLLKRFWPPTTVVIVNQDELDRPQGGG